MTNVVVVVSPFSDEEIAEERSGISFRGHGTWGSLDLHVDRPGSKTVLVTVALCLSPLL